MLVRALVRASVSGGAAARTALWITAAGGTSCSEDSMVKDELLVSKRVAIASLDLGFRN